MTFSVLFASSADHLPPPEQEGQDTASKAVAASAEVRIVNISLAAGARLAEHSAPHPILVQVLVGQIEFTCADEVTRLAAGGLVSVAGGVRHAVRALTPSSLLITFLL